MRRWYAPVVIAVGFIVSAAAYRHLPATMPAHWGWRGQPDRYGGRLQGAFALPLAALVLLFVMRALPRIDPPRSNYAKFSGAYRLSIEVVVSLLVVLHLIRIGAALGWPISLARAVPIAVGVALIVLGNVLPKARSNWWFGIRTPWTLSNDRVWTRTHRLGGYLAVVSGLFWLLHGAAAAPWSRTLALLVSGLAVLASVLYSYLAWREETTP